MLVGCTYRYMQIYVHVVVAIFVSRALWLEPSHWVTSDSVDYNLCWHFYCICRQYKHTHIHIYTVILYILNVSLQINALITRAKFNGENF